MIAKDQSRQALSEVLRSHTRDRGNLISLLQDTQAKLGYVSRDAMRAISEFLDIPQVEVWGVTTFYNQFRLAPLGKHHTVVCMGTACHLAGGNLILEALERELDIKAGETGSDGAFSLERVACIGCCMLAPVMLVGDKIYPRMTPFKAEEALLPYRQADDRGTED